MSGIVDESEAQAHPGAVYFTSLRVANVRCFGPEQHLDLADGNRASKWTVLLGENGVGKTTLLQCLWAMSPSIEDRQESSRPKICPRGFSSKRFDALRRDAASRPLILAEVLLDEPMISERVGSVGHMSLEVTPSGGSLASLEGFAHAREVLCCGYGALRRSAEANVEAGALVDSAASLFSDNMALSSGSEWLLRADYAATTTTDHRAAMRRDKIRTALIDLLPDVMDLRVAGLDEKTPRPRIEARTHYGWVPMQELGLGYRSMIAWIVDFASRMFESYPDSADPLAEPAIALVDEIDLHLHPRWQREITAHLDRLFPNVQFIVTAHSPLVVQAAGVKNVAVLRRVDDHVEIVNDPDEVRGWRVDQILTSDLFGLRSARPVEVERLLERQQELVLLDAPTEAQQSELAEIDAKLSGLAPGETAKERETWAIVRRLAGRLAGHGS